MDRVRIAIIGAGISGLTLSHALDVFAERYPSLQIDIYEASSVLSEIGAGINIWPRTWRILKTLGLEEPLLNFLPHIPDDLPRLVFEIRKVDQPEGFHILDMTTPGGTTRLHRRTLQKILLACLPEGRLHLSRRLSSYEELENEVRLHFTDGSTATCVMLVGADGIRSIVRQSFVQGSVQDKMDIPTAIGEASKGDAVWSGTYAYRGLVPFEKLEESYPNHRAIETPVMHVICYPLPHERTVNIVAVASYLEKEGSIHSGPQSTSCDKEEDGEVQHLIGVSKWAVMSLVPLERFSRGRVVLVGDAAHGMTPHQGAGAGQAIEDVYVLASLLSHKLSNTSTIPRISEIYDAIRCPIANRVLNLAREAGHITELIAPGFEDVREGDADVPQEKLQILFEGLINKWKWVWNDSAEDDRLRAIAMLEE
ncbi:salicylate hydroxylase [Pholiota conissans]|uniref:Salicylate hydroxylase n=1 Tax=Pholiota conissans TaxID=109636 RepID=A0A9P5YNY5_9AGAR|nr:salicylate hydroxylase [Pholiota conissans]